MAYYYIRDNGTFIGTGTGITSSVTKRTGAWDTNVANSFSSISDYLLSNPPAGSIAIVAADHNHSYSAATTLKLSPIAGHFEYYSASILNQDQYKIGAKENVTLGDFTLGLHSLFYSSICVSGISFINLIGDIFIYLYPSYGSFTDSTIVTPGVLHLPDSSTVKFNFCNINALLIKNSAKPAIIEFNGGSMSVSGTSLIALSGIARFNSVDLSGCANNIAIATGSNYVQTGTIELHKCKMPPTWRLQETEGTYPCTIEVLGTSCDNGNGYHYFFKKDAAYGEVTEMTNVGLNYKYDGVNFASALIASNSRVTTLFQNRFKLCEIPAQNLSVTDTTYRVQLLLDTSTHATLTDTEFWIEVSHNNNTSLALGDVTSSRNTNILAVGTELTLSAEAWQGTLPSTHIGYQVDVLIPAASYANVKNGNVVVYVNLAVPNTDIYIDPAVQIGT